MPKRKLPQFRTEERIEKFSRILQSRQKSLTIVLENVHDPHNVSAVLRSCDAVGIYEVNLVYNNNHEFPKLGEKSSASARKWVYQKHYRTIDECYSNLRSEGKKIFTTNMASDSVSLYDLDLAQPVALVFGNEHDGVSEEATNKADGNFLIPQVGLIQSLNISVACAVSLFEAYRQRELKGLYNIPQFEKPEFELELNQWLSK